MKNYIELEDMQRDFTNLGRELTTHFSSLKNMSEAFKDSKWKSMFISSIRKTMKDKPIKYKVKTQVINDYLALLNSINYSVETLTSMLQQLRTDFDSDKSITRKKLLAKIPELIKNCNEQIIYCLQVLSDFYYSISPLKSKINYKNLFGIDFETVKEFRLLLDNVVYNISVLTKVNAGLEQLDSLILYHKIEDNKNWIMLSDKLYVPTYEPQDSYVNKNVSPTNIQNLLTTLGISKVKANKIYNTIPSSITVDNAQLIIPLEKTGKDEAIKVCRSIKSKLKANKIDINPKFITDGLKVKMNLGRILLSDKTAKVIQNILGLNQRVITELNRQLEEVE